MRLIVFDLDHTLLKGNSSYHFGRYLYQKKYFSFWTLLSSLLDYARHKWCGLPMRDLHKNSLFRIFKGRPHQEISTLVSHFLGENFISLLNEPVHDRLKAAQAAGHHVLILSSSPDFLVGEIARQLSVEMWKASTYDVDTQGCFSGFCTILDGESKVSRMSELAQRLSIPLSGVTAYSDSHLDLPLLNLVGQAICVGPDHRLKRICLKNGWEIIH